MDEAGELPDTEEIPFEELLTLTADMHPPRVPLPTAPPYDYEADTDDTVDLGWDGWDAIESGLGCVLRFVFYVFVCVVLIAVTLAVFFVFTTWLTNTISENAY